MSDHKQENKEILRTVQHLLGSHLKITMTDGRTATGNFTCLDRLGNIVLSDVCERRVIGYDDTTTSSLPELRSTDDDGCVNEASSTQEQEKNNEQKNIYKWDTERCLSQAVIPGGKLLKVEISKREWEDRVDSTLSEHVSQFVSPSV
mmetsp:Transcript_17505/g.36484  ORF Transcript_17505/g.36484 Transcript_17505/m.36484 type:complete len:147 (-) Transcript_17505:512-952(-)